MQTPEEAIEVLQQNFSQAMTLYSERSEENKILLEACLEALKMCGSHRMFAGRNNFLTRAIATVQKISPEMVWEEIFGSVLK